MSTKTVQAPFTPEQVSSLNGYQFSNTFHPFTCPNKHISLTLVDEKNPDASIRIFSDEEIALVERHRKFHVWEDHLRLVAFEDGWHCPGQVCDYRQDWAHLWMADRSWQNVQPLVQKG